MYICAMHIDIVHMSDAQHTSNQLFEYIGQLFQWSADNTRRTEDGTDGRRRRDGWTVDGLRRLDGRRDGRTDRDDDADDDGTDTRAQRAAGRRTVSGRARTGIKF